MVDINGTDVALKNSTTDGYSFELKVTVSFLSIVLLLVGIPTNLLIIWTYTIIKRLHIAHNTFVVSLAVTDTIIIGYLLPFNVAFVIMNSCVVPETLCHANTLVAHICFATSVQTIMHIAINRYVKICHQNYQYMKIYNTRNVTIFIVSCWSLGSIFAIYLLFDTRHMIYDKTLQMCIFDRYSDRIYTNMYQGFCLGVPLFVTTVCYVLIYRHMSKKNSQLVQHWNNGLARERYRHDMNATKAHLTVFIAYLVLYLPFGIVATMFDSAKRVPNGVHALTITLCFVNSCINGLIYGLFNRNMRRAYKEALPCFKGIRRIAVKDAPKKSNDVSYLIHYKTYSTSSAKPTLDSRESEV